LKIKSIKQEIQWHILLLGVKQKLYRYMEKQKIIIVVISALSVIRNNVSAMKLYWQWFRKSAKGIVVPALAN